jgi:hypothetical protein
MKKKRAMTIVTGISRQIASDVIIKYVRTPFMLILIPGIPQIIAAMIYEYARLIISVTI